MSHITFSCLQQKQCSSVVLLFVPSSEPGSSDESTDGSLSDYDSPDDLSSEGEREEDDLYQPVFQVSKCAIDENRYILYLI